MAGTVDGRDAMEGILYQDTDPDLLEARRMYPHLFESIDVLQSTQAGDRGPDDDEVVHNVDAKDYSHIDVTGIEVERWKGDPQESTDPPTTASIPSIPSVYKRPDSDPKFTLTDRYILFYHHSKDPILRHSEIFASVIPDRETVALQELKVSPPIPSSDQIPRLEDDSVIFSRIPGANESLEDVALPHEQSGCSEASSLKVSKQSRQHAWCFPLYEPATTPPSVFLPKKTAKPTHEPAKVNNNLLQMPLPESLSNFENRNVFSDEEGTLFSPVEHYFWEYDIIWDLDEDQLKLNNSNSLDNDSSMSNDTHILPASFSQPFSCFHLPTYYEPCTFSSVTKDRLIYLSSDFDISQFSDRVLLYSIFPPVNRYLIVSDWESQIIWDDEAQRPPLPRLQVQMNDLHMLFEPENASEYDSELDAANGSSRPQAVKKKPRKRHLLLPSCSLQSTELLLRSHQDALKHIDKFNLSNDKYYLEGTQAVARAQKSAILQHSMYALLNVLMKPSLTTSQLKHWHKPVATFEVNRVYSIDVRSNKRKEQRKQVLSLDIMKRKKDLSAREGRVIIIEYMEERPPMIMDIGMASRICNYCRKVKDKPNKPTLSFVDGEDVFLEVEDASPFLGDIKPGSQLQSLENNLFKAPIFLHTPEETDFLLIRTERRNKQDVFYVREIPALYIVGQLHPMLEVPAPNSRQSTHYIKQRLQQYVFHMFRQKLNAGKVNEEATMKIKEIQDMFGQSENAIRKRLKVCAEFKRGGDDSGAWVLKPNFVLKSDEEIRTMVTLDDVCTYESQLVTAHRLQELGINSTHSIGTPFHRAVLALTDPYRAKIARFIGIELELTSWNLTSNFIKAKFQQGLLQLTGLGTATSTHDSYSYLRRPMKVANLKAEKEKEAKTQVTGTDRDLRKLDLPGLKAILKSYGMKDEEIDALPRWDQVDKVRSFANQSKAIDEDVEDDKHKFARGSRHNVATHQELYDATCQTIFNNQVKELSNTVPPELDEEDSSDLAEVIGLDYDDDTKHTSGKKTSQQQEKDEERLYQEFVKSLETKAQTDEDNNQNQPNISTSQPLDTASTEFKDDNTISSKYGSILGDPNFVSVPLHPAMRIPLKPGLYIKVTRTSLDGYEECQWSDNPVLIEAAKLKDRKPTFLAQSSFPKRLLTKPLSETEERERANKKREKRKLQERLRRQKNHAKRQFQLQQVMLGKINAAVPKSNNKLRCGRCGMIGHMRTNRDCPFYTEEDAYLYSFPTKLRRSKSRRYESDYEDLYDSEEYETPVDEFDNYDFRGLPEPSSHDQGLDDDKMNDEDIDYVQNDTRDIDRIQFSDQQEIIEPTLSQENTEHLYNTGLPSSSLDQQNQENPPGGSQKTQEEEGLTQICDDRAVSNTTTIKSALPSVHQQEKLVVKLKAHDRLPASSPASSVSSDIRVRHAASYPVKKRKSVNSDGIDLISDDDAELTELDLDEYDDDSSEFFASRTSRRSVHPRRGNTLSSSTPSQDRSSKTNRSSSSYANSSQLCQALKQIFDPIYSNFVYEAFKHKVNIRDFPDYPLVIKRPMHMDIIQNKLRKGAYHSVQEFITDWELIEANCIAYNQNTSNQNLIGYAKNLVSEVKNAIHAQYSTFQALDSLYIPPDVTAINSNNLKSYESQVNFVS